MSGIDTLLECYNSQKSDFDLFLAEIKKGQAHHNILGNNISKPDQSENIAIVHKQSKTSDYPKSQQQQQQYQKQISAFEKYSQVLDKGQHFIYIYGENTAIDDHTLKQPTISTIEAASRTSFQVQDLLGALQTSQSMQQKEKANDEQQSYQVSDLLGVLHEPQTPPLHPRNTSVDPPLCSPESIKQQLNINSNIEIGKQGSVEELFEVAAGQLPIKFPIKSEKTEEPENIAIEKIKTTNTVEEFFQVASGQLPKQETKIVNNKQVGNGRQSKPVAAVEELFEVASSQLLQADKTELKSKEGLSTSTSERNQFTKKVLPVNSTLTESNIEKKQIRKTWGEISAEKRPNNRRSYYIIGDKQRFEEGAFPTLGPNTSLGQSSNSQNAKQGAWGQKRDSKYQYPPLSSSLPQSKVQQSGTVLQKDESNISIVCALSLKFGEIDEEIVRSVLESVEYNGGIAEEILREMQMECDQIQGSSESESENVTPHEHSNPLHRERTNSENNGSYQRHRSEAVKLTREAKKLSRRSLRAYRNGSQLEGEYLMKEAGEKHKTASELHDIAAKKIFEEVNQGNLHNPWIIDLHGLYPQEAVTFVNERLELLQEFSVYEKNKQPLEIITGKGLHSQDGESILSIVVDNLLRGKPFQHTVRGGTVLVWMGRKRSVVSS
eukprot:TRINITY_DN16208_c0_g1_i2.p1 TRINITY_DN16208_c0_g1~~TRINITY_DN16208_c0_g1_i2.p1  ORF type:complete len:663 (+),score=90.38 TRINITY_DN16208_c0_g1_i2:360-2348(+)